MKILLRVIVALAALWSLAWLAGSVALERVVTAWLADRDAAGWIVAHEGVETNGFPLRFQTMIHTLTLADPFTGWALTAGRFDLRQDSHRPQAIRAVWPPEHALATPYERLTIRADRLESLLHVQPLQYLALEQSETVMSGLSIESDLGWTSALDDAEARVTRRDDPGHRYDITFVAQGVVPAGEVLELIDPVGALPESIERLHVAGIMGFDRAWDLSALERSRPGITRIELAELRAEWGDLALRVSGDLDVDADGVPTGNLAIRAQNWRQMIELGANAGAVPDAFRGTLETGLAMLAGLSGRPEDLDATLRFSDGQVYLGPIPLGPAPLFVLR